MPTLPFGLDQFCSPLAQAFIQLWSLVSYLGIPLPIGIIGAWRWGIWLLRRLVGMWYRPQKPNGYSATTAVITPVYNEDPDLFRAALRSWAANGPDEIIAVIDHTDKRCMEQFTEFEAECAGSAVMLKMLITHTPGKRPALADGILAATSEIVFLVDSDTIWAPDVLPKALAPFHEAEVGGVTMRQRVWHPHSTAQRIFDVYLDIRYIDEIRFLTAFGDAVTCLSGRTAVYRRFVALTALEDLMEEKFFGRPVISGDDKALTLAVQKRGWKVRYQENACVYTPGATVMKVFLKQRLRWARNSWRADLKALFSRWVWRHPILAFHLIDRLFQPFTTLVAPLYLGFALFHRNWPAVIFLISWWFLSRSIKIWPHLRQHWRNIRILPWYIFFNYWSAVMKIYAFFTMNQQGWITRWSRGGKGAAWLKSLQAAPSYAATAVTVGLVALFVHSLHEMPVRAADLQIREPQPVASLDPAAFLSTAWENGWTPPAMGQCQASWVLPLPESIDAQATLAQTTLFPQQAHATTPDPIQQICILAGDAKGLCAPYTIAPAQSSPASSASVWQPISDKSRPLLHTVQEWWSLASKPLMTMIHSDETDQWRNWWQESGAATTLDRVMKTLPSWEKQPAAPAPTAESSLCILQGEHQGVCRPYRVK